MGSGSWKNRKENSCRGEGEREMDGLTRSGVSPKPRHSTETSGQPGTSHYIPVPVLLHFKGASP